MAGSKGITVSVESVANPTSVAGGESTRKDAVGGDVTGRD